MKIGSYILSVILTLLLIFTVIGFGIVYTANTSLDAGRTVKIAEDLNLSETVHQNIENYFADMYSATGIPAWVYMKSLTPEWVSTAVKSQIRAGFEGFKHQDRLIAAPFTDEQLNPSLNADIAQFYYDYAAENSIETDSAFDEKILQVQRETQDKVLEFTDVFMFRKLYSQGVYEQIRNITSKDIMRFVLAGIAIVGAAIIGIILLINRKNKPFALYWTGIAAIIAGVIEIIPCIYIRKTKYFDGFVVKKEVYTVVTSFLYSLNDILFNVGLCTTVIGALVLILFGITRALTRLSVNNE